MSGQAESSYVPSHRMRGERAAVLFLLLGTAIPLCIRLGAAPPTIKAEMRCWEVVVGMHETGQWLVPYRNGQPALNKPPLFYWAGALASRAAGKAAYATLRAPSAAAALALLALTWCWARSIGGPKVGLAAGGVMAFSWIYFHQGRNGSFEMLLALLTNAALFLFDRMYWTIKGRLWPKVLFFLLAAAAFLTKGPPAFLIIAVPIVLFLGFRKEMRRLAAWRVFLGAAACLALSLSWFLVVLIRVPGAWERFMSEALLPAGIETTTEHTARHYADPSYFVVRLPVILRISALLLPLLVWRGWTTRFWRDMPRLRFCGWIAAGLLVAFSLFPQKQEHYILPLVPAYAILAAEAAVWAADPQSGMRWVWLGIPAIVLFILTLFCAVFLGFYFHILLRIPLANALALPVALLLLSGAGLWLAARRKWPASGGAFLLATWLFFSAYFASYEVVKRQFATGEIEKRSDYDAEHWLQMKRKYGFVAREFRLSSRFVKDEVPPK